MRNGILIALVALLLGAETSQAQRWVRRYRQTPPPAPSSANIGQSAYRSAAKSNELGEGIPEPNPSAGGPTVYYFDGKMYWAKLGDDTTLVWTGSQWVPPGVIFWGGNRAEDAAARASSPPGPWVHSRFNVESRNYRDRYGTDAWFMYGPGHFLD